MRRRRDRREKAVAFATPRHWRQVEISLHLHHPNRHRWDAIKGEASLASAFQPRPESPLGYPPCRLLCPLPQGAGNAGPDPARWWNEYTKYEEAE